MEKVANSKPTTGIWFTVKRVMLIAGRDRGFFYGAVLAVAAQAGLNVAFSSGLRGILDHALAGQSAAFFGSVRQLLLVLALLAPLAFAQSHCTGAFSERTLARVRRAVADGLSQLPVRAFQARHSGDLMSVMNNDVNALRTLTATDLIDAVNQIGSGSAALVYLLILSWKLTLASTIAVPLVYLLMNRVIAPIAARAAELQNEVGRVTSVAQDGLAGLTVARAFSLEPKLDERLRLANRDVLQTASRVVKLRAVANGFQNGMPILPFLITFGYGGYLAIAGQMSPGSLVAFASLLNSVTRPLSSVPRLLSSLGVAAGGAARVFELLDLPRERADGTVTTPAVDAETAVSFSGVRFGYTADAPVFRDVTFAVKRGEMVAVVGPSGGGKSTILRLLLGLFEPDGGSIELFGHNLAEWRLLDARSQMSLVAQDTYLFPVSLAENIAFGRPGASQEDIERAARLANIHEFIAGLPDGYLTVVGERGARLSGGQRQRIAIARAILKDAPLLLLDEATSALDTESEALVQEALERFMVGRTTIVIAHRLSTIRNANRLLVVDEGRIAEEGTHERLLAAGGLYHRLYMNQFAPEEAAREAALVAGGAQA